MNCVITGAADGIGRALAERFVQAGASVVGVDVDVDRAQEAERLLGISFVMADLCEEEGVEKVLQALCDGPEIDVCIHNAGINAVGRFETIDPEAQAGVVALNLTAPMVLTARLLDAGKLAAGGSLVFLSSLSYFTGYPGASVYAATKDGLASYARSLSVALQDIRVLTVFPGPTRTAHARRYSPDNSREEKRMAPEFLADRIFQAVKKRKRVLIPGFGNRVFAWMGFCFPRVTEALMRKRMLGDAESADSR
ncbi:MAG: SDR family NAD(P)-dependent oxidoreductase [bacterium]|nr:SDR family NAD(P)-dependent oxidoreductase [bacterium]